MSQKQIDAQIRNHKIMRLRGAAQLKWLVCPADHAALLSIIDRALQALGALTIKERHDKMWDALKEKAPPLS